MTHAELLKSTGMTKAEIADFLGVNPITVRRLQAGTFSLHPDQIESLYALLADMRLTKEYLRDCPVQLPFARLYAQCARDVAEAYFDTVITLPDGGK